MSRPHDGARYAAVIGHPVAHSKSPALFARFAAVSGVVLEYEAVDVLPEELAETLMRWRAMPEFVGCNVTLPHKERALALADRVEPAARACGAANVLTREDGALVAGNTDVAGVESALAQHGVALRGVRVAIIGAGGAARAVAEAARRNGAAEIVVGARDPARAAALAADFDTAASAADFDAAASAVDFGDSALTAGVGAAAHGGSRAIACALEDVPVADVYVNATPVGMHGQPQISLLPANAPSGAAAFDLVYTPEETPFLIDARARGMVTVPGTAMFVAQAVATW
ncbi:MAG TPA: NAD(P)-binding domain-containing protein, partial [Candidatus Elarobacter sp.]|nr:NAD(P)-binding domain-containing protein [Candidatus Elarobacter sp.]